MAVGLNFARRIEKSDCYRDVYQPGAASWRHRCENWRHTQPLRFFEGTAARLFWIDSKGFPNA